MPSGGYRPNAGRRPGNAADLRRSQWFARVAQVRELLAEIDEWHVVKHAIEQHVHHMVGLTASRIVHDAMESEQSAKRMQEKQEGTELRLITKDEALTVLLHLKMSKNQYSELRKMLDGATDARFIPHYDTVANHKKLCRPENPLNVTEVLAQVELQKLLDHTVRRITQAREEHITTKCNDFDRHECTLIATFGFDSATGQRRYQQNFVDPANKNRTDSSLFAATLNPIILKTRHDVILWENKFAQSPLFVRPLLLEYEKETADYVRRIDANLRGEIENLQPVEIVTANNRRLLVKFCLIESQVDGKVFNILTNTSSQSCPACRAPRSQLNNVENLGTEDFDLKERGSDFGLGSMHAFIKFLRLLLNLGYRLGEHSEDPDIQGQTREERKKIIKDAFKRELKLRIEEPSPDGRGSCMDGNTSRRAFKDPNKLASILGINPDLVHRFRNILLAINCSEYRLHPEIFEHYAHETYRLYVELYPWMKISPSVHKILAHGGAIQAVTPISMGAASESGSELCHKIRKDVRRNFTRKTSRLDQHQDLFGRCMDLSDPVISEAAIKFCDKYRTSDELPPEVLQLLDTNPRPGRPRQAQRTRRLRPNNNVGANNGLPPPNYLPEMAELEDREDQDDFGAHLVDNGDDTDYDEEF